MVHQAVGALSFRRHLLSPYSTIEVVGRDLVARPVADFNVLQVPANHREAVLAHTLPECARTSMPSGEVVDENPTRLAGRTRDGDVLDLDLAREELLRDLGENAVVIACSRDG